MKLAAWNIQQGGASRAAAIVEVIARHDPDVLILSELRPRSTALLGALAAKGWKYQHTGIEQNKTAAVGVVSRTPTIRLAPARPAEVLPGRWIEVWSPAHSVVVCGVYGPLQNERHRDFWTAVRASVPDRLDGNYLLGGDLNTGESLLDAPNPKFFCSEHFVGLRDAGIVDLWRHRNGQALEYSYHHGAGGSERGPGFRIDHLLASARLADRLEAVEYDRSVLESRTSDHALLSATFRLS